MMNWENKYITCSFKDGGREYPEVDCWGLVSIIYKDILNIDLPSYGDISSSSLLSIAKKINTDTSINTWERVDEPRQFDVAIMTGRVKHKGVRKLVNIHLGVVTSSNKILHIEDLVGTAIVGLDNPVIKNRISNFFRYVGQ